MVCEKSRVTGKFAKRRRRRDSVTRFFASGFFHQSVSPQPQSIPFGPFQIFSKIRGDIRRSRLTTGVVDTGGKWKKSSIKKILIILLGHLWIVEVTHIYIFAFKFTLRYLQPDIIPIVCHRCQRHRWQNLPPVSLYRWQMCHRCRWYRWQFCRHHRCRWYRWSTLSFEYLREFSKKFETALMVYSGAWGKLIHGKNTGDTGGKQWY